MPTLLQARSRQARCYLTRAERLAQNYEALTRDRSSLLLALQSALDLELYDDLVRGIAALAGFLNSTGDQGEATRFVEAALSRVPGSGTGAIRARLHYERGLLARYAGDFGLAREQLQAARGTAQAAGDAVREGWADAAMGWLHYDLGELDEASLCFERVLQAPGVAHDGDLVSAVQHSSGNVAFVRGRYDEARRRYLQALELARQVPVEERCSNILHDLGWVELRSGNLDEARRRFAEGLVLAEQTGSLERRCSLLQGLGATAERRGDFDGAQAHWTAALEIARSIGYPALAAGLLHNLGGLASARGDADEARRFLSQALAWSETMEGQRQRRASVLSTLGWLALRQGDLDDADERFTAARQEAGQNRLSVAAGGDRTRRERSDLAARGSGEADARLKSAGDTAGPWAARRSPGPSCSTGRHCAGAGRYGRGSEPGPPQHRTRRAGPRPGECPAAFAVAGPTPAAMSRAFSSDASDVQR
jgi:tetratricopeptide (TPR) repeat protein